MNNKIIWIAVILSVTIAIFSKFIPGDKNSNEFKPLDKNIGDEFTEISYPNKMFIINYTISDVTGDAEKDMVLLVGEKSGEEAIANSNVINMDVVIYDVSNSAFIKADSKRFNGSDNRITIADFTGDKIQDIAIINLNDGKMCARIYSYEKGELNEIWRERENKGLIFTGEFVDGFKCQIVNSKLNFSQFVNVSNKSKEYIANAIYDNSGKMKKADMKVKTSGYITIDIVELNDRNGIKTVQRVLGMDNNDIIDEINCVWKYQDGKWQMVEAKGLKFGNLLY